MANDTSLNLLDSFYYDFFIPPNWQAVFHEANRANHVLFDQSLAPELDQEQGVKLSTEDEDKIADAALSILSAYDVSAMRTIIKSLTETHQRFLFRVYLRLLAHYRERFKNNLN